MEEKLFFFSKKFERILKNKNKEKNFSQYSSNFTYINYSNRTYQKLIFEFKKRSKNMKKREVKNLGKLEKI